MSAVLKWLKSHLRQRLFLSHADKITPPASRWGDLIQLAFQFVRRFLRMSTSSAPEIAAIALHSARPLVSPVTGIIVLMM